MQDQKTYGMINLSIIIVNYHTETLLRQCIQSFFKFHSSENVEVVVVNNGGDLHSVKMELTNLPIVYLEAPENLGFSKANNLGLHEAKGEFILYVNSDVIFHQPVIPACIHSLNNNAEIGAVGCKLLNKDLSLQLSYHDGDKVFSRLWWRNPFCIKWMKGSIKAAKSMKHISELHQKDHFPHWITGALMVLRRSDIFKYNWTWDEGFFMYWEDVELCYRIRKSGKRIFYLAEPSVIHLVGGGAEVALERFSWLEDSKLLFLKKQSKFKHWLYQRWLRWELKLENRLIKRKKNIIINPDLYLQKELEYYGIK